MTQEEVEDLVLKLNKIEVEWGAAVLCVAAGMACLDA